MCFLVQTTSHWNTRSSNDRPWQLCVFRPWQTCIFLFKRYHTEIPVLLEDRPWQLCVFFFKWHPIEILILLMTDLDNRVFSCSNDITLKYPFYYRPTLTIVCFLVQTTSHWNTRSTNDRSWQSCVFQPWQSCVFLFKRHHTEIPVLLTTDLDNRVFSDLDNLVFWTFLVQTTSHWNTYTTYDRPWQSCVFQPWQSCVFLFKRHHTEIPVLLMTDLTIVCFPTLTIVCFLTLTNVCFLVQTTSHWNTRSTLTILCFELFLFKQNHTEIPVLLTTDLDNRVFSDLDNLVFWTFLVQTTSHWNTRSTNDRPWQLCVFRPWQSCVFWPWQTCVFLFRRHHTEVPVLLSTDLRDPGGWLAGV